RLGILNLESRNRLSPPGWAFSVAARCRLPTARSSGGPMVHECAHRYSDGRRCRRIPKRGETLCRDHKRSRRRTPTEDPAFCRQMVAYTDRLITLPLDVLAAEVQFALAAMHPIFDSRFSRTWRLLFSRAE